MRLERYLTKLTSCSTQEVRRWLIKGLVSVNEKIIRNPGHEINRFSKVTANGETLPHETAIYLMLHKPVGFLSATTDPVHPTVLDLIDHPQKDELHLAGRLDRNTSGLVLLTNDGRWSKHLSAPASKVPKVYLVKTESEIPPDAVEKFATGFHFHTEGIITQPAKLEILTPTSARLVLTEGRYHQVKRMFHRVDIKVFSLHRVSIGPYSLPKNLEEQQWSQFEPMPTIR